jgi:hypothetical protein
MINTSGNGRFGNQFFRNMVGYLLSKKYDKQCIFQECEDFNKLGIYFKSKNVDISDISKKKNVYITEENIINFLKEDVVFDYNIFFNNVYCQSKYVSQLIYDLFNNKNNKLHLSVINNNKFKYNYNNNDDVFIHIRLGDIIPFIESRCPPIQYYENILDNLEYKNGYIASDSIDHDMCKKLIFKYNLKIINYDKIETILFGSTFKNVILSTGTFSWLIGILSFYSSNIYYYNPAKIIEWYGPIFEINFDKNKWKMKDIKIPNMNSFII